MSDYFNKYIKYKKKYLELAGGADSYIIPQKKYGISNTSNFKNLSKQSDIIINNKPSNKKLIIKDYEQYEKPYYNLYDNNLYSKKKIFEDTEIESDIEDYKKRLQNNQLIQVPEDLKLSKEQRLKKYQGPSKITLYAGFKHDYFSSLGKTSNYTLVDGPAEKALFHFPTGIKFDSNQNLLVVDSDNHCIRIVNRVGYVKTYAGNGKPGLVNGKFDQAQFNQPSDIAISPNGDVFVVDSYNHCIRKIESNGYVSTVVGSDKKGYVDGSFEDARFNRPQSAALNSKGDLFVTENNNHCIRKIDFKNNMVTTLIGKKGNFKNSEEGSFKDKDFFLSPYNIIIDSNDDIIVSDQVNFRIIKIDMQEKYVSEIYSSYRKGNIMRLAYSPLGDIFFTDGSLNKIYHINTNNEVSEISNISCNYITGESEEVKYIQLNGITVNSKGDIFVSDSLNNCIYKIPLNYYNRFTKLSNELEVNINCEELKKKFYISQGKYGICWMVSTLLMFAYSGIKLDSEIERFVFQTLRLFKLGEVTNCPLLPKKIRKRFDNLYGYTIKMIPIETKPDNIFMIIKKEIFEKNYIKEKNIYLHSDLEERGINHKLIINGNLEFIKVEGTNDYYMINIEENQGNNTSIFIKSILDASDYNLLVELFSIEDTSTASDLNSISKNINTFYKIIQNKDLIKDNDFPVEDNILDSHKRDKLLNYKINFLEKKGINNEYKKLLEKLLKFNKSKKNAILNTIILNSNMKICTLNKFLLQLNFKTAIIIIGNKYGRHAMCITKCKKNNQILYCNSWGEPCKSLIEIYYDKKIIKSIPNFKIISIIIVTIPKRKQVKLSDKTKYDRGLVHQELLSSLKK
jgi:hypothetical protein